MEEILEKKILLSESNLLEHFDKLSVFLSLDLRQLNNRIDRLRPCFCLLG